MAFDDEIYQAVCRVDADKVRSRMAEMVSSGDPLDKSTQSDATMYIARKVLQAVFRGQVCLLCARGGYDAPCEPCLSLCEDTADAT